MALFAIHWFQKSENKGQYGRRAISETNLSILYINSFESIGIAGRVCQEIENADVTFNFSDFNSSKIYISSHKQDSTVGRMQQVINVSRFARRPILMSYQILRNTYTSAHERKVYGKRASCKDSFTMLRLRQIIKNHFFKKLIHISRPTGHRERERERQEGLCSKENCNN